MRRPARGYGATRVMIFGRITLLALLCTRLATPEDYSGIVVRVPVSTPSGIFEVAHNLSAPLVEPLDAIAARQATALGLDDLVGAEASAPRIAIAWRLRAAAGPGAPSSIDRCACGARGDATGAR